MWCAGQTSGAGALKHCFELNRRVTGFRATKPERHYAIAHRRDRPIGHYPRLFNRSLAGEIEHKAHADTKLSLGPGASTIKRGQLIAESQTF